MHRLLRRKWLICVALFGILLLPVASFVYWHSVRETGRTRLAETIRKLDETEPGWAKDELAAAHNASLPSEDRNSLRLIREMKAALPPHSGDPDPDWLKQPANTLPRPGELVEHRKYLAEREPALTIARRLVDYPDGGRPVRIAENPIDTLLNEVQDTREAAWLLKLDALVAAEENRPADAVRSIRAIVNAGRAIGDEPLVSSQLTRTACVAISCDTTERVLGRCEPTDGLTELQAELLREADFPRLYHSARAERASLHQIFLLLEAGKLDGVGSGGWLARLSLIPDYSAEEHAIGLEWATAFVEANRRAPDEQWAAIQALPALDDDVVRRDRRYLLTALFFAMSAGRGVETAIRTRGWLLATAAGIACERYRQRFGRWPDSLDDIPKDILPAVPNDPFTGRPISYRRLPDGAVVYSVGPDGQDDGGRFFEETSDATGRRKSRDYGIRLWDSAHRRAPAPPPEPKEGETGPDGDGPEVAPPPRVRP